MSTKQKFCSECGAPLAENDRFCPVCGAKVIGMGEPEKKKNFRKKAPISPTNDMNGYVDNSDAASLGASNSLSSAFQWAIIWIVGWLPNWSYGILHFNFISEKIISFGVSTFIGGFASGIVLNKILNRTKLTLGIGANITLILAWILFWEILFGIENEIYEVRNIGYLLAAIFASTMALFAIRLLEKKYDFKTAKDQKIIIAVSWGTFAILSLILSRLMITLL